MPAGQVGLWVGDGADNEFDDFSVRDITATVKWEWNGSSEPGVLVRWLSPGDWLPVGLSPTDGKVRLYRRKGDDLKVDPGMR